MEKNEYEALIETVSEQYDLEMPDKLSIRLASRAHELEFEHLSFDDIFDELIEVIPENFKNEDSWQDFLGEIADEVFDNINDDDTEEEFDEDDD
jgi:hypothetical protein